MGAENWHRNEENEDEMMKQTNIKTENTIKILKIMVKLIKERAKTATKWDTK